jgi:hypothetical protein
VDGTVNALCFVQSSITGALAIGYQDRPIPVRANVEAISAWQGRHASLPTKPALAGTGVGAGGGSLSLRPQATDTASRRHSPPGLRSADIVSPLDGRPTRPPDGGIHRNFLKSTVLESAVQDAA